MTFLIYVGEISVKKRVAMFTVVIFLAVHGMFGSEKIKTENFEFKYDGNILAGFLDLPESRAASGIVILVPGYGKRILMSIIGIMIRCDLPSYNLDLPAVRGIKRDVERVKGLLMSINLSRAAPKRFLLP